MKDAAAQSVDALLAHLAQTREPPPAMPPLGWHRGVCVDVVLGGPVQTVMGPRPTVRFVFELEAERLPGYRWIVGRTFDCLFFRTSPLRLFLEGWQGYPYEDGLSFEDHYLGLDGEFRLVAANGRAYPVIARPRQRGRPVRPDGFFIRAKYRPEKKS